MDRTEALDLLRAEHTFPGPYRFRVVVKSGGEPSVVSALSAVEGLSVSDVSKHPSRNGTYVSVRVVASVQAAETVLEGYAVVQLVDGVMATM